MNNHVAGRSGNRPGTGRVGRITAALAATTVAALALGACAFSDSDDPEGDIAVAAPDSKCDVSRKEAKAGNVAFEVSNKGTKVTEFYVYAKGDRIMGEVENVGPGLKRRLIVELPAGSYETACKPGMKGDGIRGKSTVTGKAEAAKDNDAKLAEATESYKRYVNSQAAALVEQTTLFVNAVKSGDAEKAKNLFAVSRVYYERIEPVAEAFGDLDPAIDEREDDPSLAGPEFTGYHRLEKALWQDNNISDMGPIADRLLADVRRLKAEASFSTGTRRDRWRRILRMGHRSQPRRAFFASAEPA